MRDRYLLLKNKPLYVAPKSCNDVRDEVSDVLKLSQRTKMIVPFTTDGEPYWNIHNHFDKSWMNHEVAAFPVLLAVIRDYPLDFWEFIDGKVINNKKKFNDLKSKLNSIYIRIIDGLGSASVPGQCTEDEFIRLGCLFFLYIKSCKKFEGIKIDSFNRFDNRWSGKDVKITFPLHLVREYSSRLNGCYMANLTVNQFFTHGLRETDEDTVWFLHPPEITGDGSFDTKSFISLMDKLPQIRSKGGKYVVLMREQDNLINIFKKFFGFESEKDYYINDDMYLFPDEIEDYVVVSNYTIK